MAARKQTAMKPASATIEDISTQIPLSAHRLTRDHNDCTGLAGAASYYLTRTVGGWLGIA
jgi:hypothetical protein